MADKIQLTPTAGASTNPLGIVFGVTATLEFVITPERVINKDISGIELTMVDLAGVHVHKGPLDAIIPWSNIISLVY